MKGPVALLMLATVLCTLVLWAGVTWFADDPGNNAARLALSRSAHVPDSAQAGSQPVSAAAEAKNPVNALAVSASDDESDTEPGTALAGQVELDARDAARRQRLQEVGILSDSPRPAPTVAIDVSLDMPPSCEGADIASVPIGVKFLYESAQLKGESLSALESLIAFYRKCASGQFILAENPAGQIDATEILTQMRFDEMKYFFIQHSVSIDAVQLSEE